MLPRVLPSLRRTYPDLRLYLREDQTERLAERLKTGDLDALLLAMPVNEPSFQVDPLFDESFVVALPAGHRLAAGNQVTELDLTGEHVLLLEEGHCFREQAWPSATIRARANESAKASPPRRWTRYGKWSPAG